MYFLSKYRNKYINIKTKVNPNEVESQLNLKCL